MKILAVETSCDDTCVAIVEAKTKPGQKIPNFKILANIISSQTSIHQEYGGVVPSLAKREHQKNLAPVLGRTLREAELFTNEKLKNKNEKIQSKIKNVTEILDRNPVLLDSLLDLILTIKKPKIDLIAVTYGPGLEPALWTGINFARALSCWWNVPLLGVDHMEGHLAANFIGGSDPPVFPAVCLAVSGGHTQLILIRDINKYKLLGETLDDAAGEGFDKVARLLGLSFPGGPPIAKEALQWKLQSNSKSKDYFEINLPRPMAQSGDYNFSFSGLKTAVLYDFKKRSPKIQKSKEYIRAMSYQFQQAVIDVLISKTTKAAKEYKAKTVMLAGGVAANKELRKQLGYKVESEMHNTKYIIPNTILATDNAAMIATAAYFRKDKASLTKWKTLKANGSLRIK
jgi:N6-L-threonylcarbamoyladenine synthase